MTESRPRTLPVPLAAAIFLPIVALSCASLLDIPTVTLARGDAATSTVDAIPSPDAVATTTSDGAPVASEAGCGDIQRDAKNCGACGHSCLGGGCSEGVCQPVTLQANLPWPWALVVDATNIYWTDRQGPDVFAASKDTANAPPTLLASGPAAGVTNPFALVHDATTLYWGNAESPSGSIVKCAKQGCGGHGKALVTADYPVSMFLDGDRLYWLEQVGGLLRSLGVADGSGAPVTIASGLTSPEQLVVDDTSVYWTDSHDYRVYLAAKNGSYDAGTLATLSQDQYYAFGLAQNTRTVFWTLYGDPGSVRSIDKPQSSPDAQVHVVAPGEANAFFIAAFGDQLYWTDLGVDVPVPNDPTTVEHPHGSLRTCDANSCAATLRVLATEQPGARSVVVTADAVYWVNAGIYQGVRGSVMKLAR